MGLDSVELIMDVEKEFEFSMSDEAAGKIRTVGQFYDLVCRESPLLRGKLSPGEYEGWAWDRFVAVVAESVGVEAQRVHPDADLVRDLGID